MNSLGNSILENEEDTQKGKFLIFMIDQEMFGIEIRHVLEIIEMQKIIEMPDMPYFIKGIINLRGKIIQVMDIRLRFKMNSKEYDDRTCVVVVDYCGVTIGFIVDTVAEVVTISDDQILSKPSVSSLEDRGFIKNIGKLDKSVIMLMDCGKVLDAELVGAKISE